MTCIHLSLSASDVADKRYDSWLLFTGPFLSAPAENYKKIQCYKVVRTSGSYEQWRMCKLIQFQFC
jgi:hypothetical protein